MKPQIVFSVVICGVAQPAGSKQAWVPTDRDGNPYRGPGGRIVVNVVDDNPKSKGWKKLVANEAWKAWGARKLLDGPLYVRAVFYQERPGAHFGTGRNSELIKQAAPAFPMTRPDLLKIMRGVEDALSKVVYVDDSRIVDEVLSKRYGSPARVEISIGMLPATVGEFQEDE